MPPDIAVVEGEKLKIHCLAMGTDPEITWTIGNYFGKKQKNYRLIYI